MAEETAVLEPLSTPESAEAAKTAIQHAFEKATESKQALKPKPPVEPTPVKPPEPVKAPEPPTPEPEPKPVDKQPELKLPSFITATEPKTEEKPPEPEIKLEDLPKEPPATASENEKINWKKTRTLLEKLESENKTLKEKQAIKQDAGKELSQVDQVRLQQLETELGSAREQLQRFGLQQHPKFITEILQPLQASYAEAKRIIKDAGGNPEALDKAMAISGKAHYDAMDEILGDLPESAKGELTSTIRDVRRLSQARATAMANAPKAFEELQKQDLVNQKQYWDNQKDEMAKLFDTRVKAMRELKFEPLIETTEENAQWWNNIPKNVIATARKIALENNDPSIVMDASLLAAAAPTLRDLWLKAEKRASTAEKELAEIKGSEPRIGNATSLPESTKEDLKEPFDKVFMRVLHAQSGK